MFSMLFLVDFCLILLIFGNGGGVLLYVIVDELLALLLSICQLFQRVIFALFAREKKG